MQSILLSAVIDALEAMKAASKGVPNLMLRDLQSVHRNTTFADLPKPVQDSIAQSVRAAFTQFLKEGYSVGPKQEVQQSRPLDRVPERQRGGPPGDRRGPDRRFVRKDPGRRGPDRPGGRPGGKPGGGRPGGPPKGKPTK
jgi:hypothetical protein